MQPLIDQVLGQVIAYFVGALLAAAVAAIGAGGFVWKKLNTNHLQDERLKALDGRIELICDVERKMMAHQLQVSCQRALNKGCISMEEFIEIQVLYDAYKSIDGNSKGEAIYEKMKAEVEVREVC